MDERTGRAVLRERFTEAGLTIHEDFPFQYRDAPDGAAVVEGEIAFSLDGYDPVQRIGYEYITTEAGDREELSPKVLAALEALIAADRVHLLLVDELEIEGADALRTAADRFLAAVRHRRAAEGQR